MALIKCSDCKRDVSDKAGSCPNCGAPVYAEAIKRPAGAAANGGGENNLQGRSLGRAETLFVVFAYAAVLVFILYDCSQTSRNGASISQEISVAEPESYAIYIPSEESFEICKAAFLAVSKDPEKTVIPFVKDQGGYAESRFTWGAGTRMLRMRNGLGFEVAATGYCGIDRKTKEIVELHLNGEKILNKSPIASDALL